MFQPVPADPETGRHVYLPDQQAWDKQENAPAADVFSELLAMSRMPVDIEIGQRGILKARLSFRGLAEFSEDRAELPTGTDRGIRIEINGIDSIVLSEREFICATASPGYVRAAFRHLEVEVSRVELGWWRTIESSE